MSLTDSTGRGTRRRARDDGRRSTSTLRRRPTSPTPPAAHYGAPGGRIHPDTSLGWMRRMQPVVVEPQALVPHRHGHGGRRAVSQRRHPRRRRRGHRRDPQRTATRSARGSSPCSSLAVLRAVFTYGYRSRLYKFAYAIEYDLRSLMFRHFAAMSHGFYDKVQTGQLVEPGQQRHPRGADAAGLRPVHVDDDDDVRAGVRLHAHQARAADAGGHLDAAARVRVRRQAPQRHVPAVVGRPGPPGRGRHHGRGERHRRPGREGLRRRAAPDRPARRPGPPAALGGGQGQRLPGQATRRSWRTCPASAWRSPCSTAATSPSTARSPSAPSSPSPATCCCSRRRSACSASS